MNGNVETPTEHIEQNHIDNDDAVSHEVHITVEQQAILKAVRAIMCIEALQNVGNIQKTAPSIEEIEADAFGFEFTVFMDTDCSIEELKQVVLHVSEIEVEVKQGEPISKEVASKKSLHEVVQVEEKLQPAVATQVESPIEATNQPSSAMPAKSTTKRKC